MMRLLLELLGVLCAHDAMYRERRKRHGVDVLHLVCPRCGHAVPVITRTARDTKAAIRDGRPRPLKAARETEPTEAVAFTRPRRRVN